MIIRPRAEEALSRNGRTASGLWLKAWWGVIDALTGVTPPRVPVVYINPTGAQKGLPLSDDAGQIVLVGDESGGAVLAFSTGGQWRRVTDRAVIS